MNAYMPNDMRGAMIALAALPIVLLVGHVVTRVSSVILARSIAWLMVVVGVGGMELYTVSQPGDHRHAALHHEDCRRHGSSSARQNTTQFLAVDRFCGVLGRDASSGVCQGAAYSASQHRDLFLARRKESDIGPDIRADSAWRMALCE